MEGWTWKALCNEAPFRFGKNLASRRVRTHDPKSGALTARPRGRFKSIKGFGNNEVLKTLTQTLKFVDADANDRGSTIVLRERCSGELKTNIFFRNLAEKMIFS